MAGTPDRSPEGKLRKAKALISEARGQYIGREDEASGDACKKINDILDTQINRPGAL